MDKTIIKVNDTEIEEYEFHQHKNPILINDIDIYSKKILNIFFPEMSIYKNSLVKLSECIL